MDLQQSSPLAKKLLTNILGVYLLIALSITAAQLYFEYRNEKEQLNKEVERVYSTFSPIFAQSIWSLNDAQIVSNMKGLMKNSNIIGIKLLDDEGKLSKALGIVLDNNGKPILFRDVNDNEAYERYNSQFTQIYERTWPVIYHSRTRGSQTIAFLVLYSNSDAVIAEVSDTFAFTIISAIVKTIFLWIIAVIVLKKRISAPLYVISKGIEKLTPILGSIDSQDSDESLSQLNENQDELSRLVGTFTKMKIALIAKETEVLNYQHNLEEANKDLEKKVLDRTKELEKANAKLQKLSITDSLTGLKNRRFFDETLNKEFKRAKRLKHYLSLVIIDIDHFKLLNDTYGHDIGDEVLAEVAQVISKSIKRENDLLARFGGEEFAILLPATDEQGAMNIAESIRKSIDQYEFFVKDQRVPLTVSIGIVSAKQDSDANSKLMFKQADEALYLSKNSGRNRTSIYRPKQESDSNDDSIAVN